MESSRSEGRPASRGLADRLGGLRDLVLLPFVVLSARVLRHFLNRGPARMVRSNRALRRQRIYPLRFEYYYSPLVEASQLASPLSEPRRLPGIDWRHDEQVQFLDRLDRRDEILELKWERPSADTAEFSLANTQFSGADADFLYQFLRSVRPGRIVEIGSGHSTKVARAAIRRNDEESGKETVHVCIEPYEAPWLSELGVELRRQRVEEVEMELFTSLEPGDLLFIDSSHVIRPQGDVLTEYLEILPCLRSGVFVHIHDIFSPRDYPERWVLEDLRLWNEQYLVEAMLSSSDRYRVVAALNRLWHEEFELLASACPHLDRGEPGSLYLQVA